MKKTIFKTVAVVLGVMVLGMVFASQASAECGNLLGRKTTGSLWQQQSGQEQAQFTLASLPLVSDHDSDAIVGFWKVTFVSKDNPGIPDGTVIDSAYVQWHSDGTEIMNSSRPPATSNFCLGVWKKVGRSRYKLNHFAISSDLNGNLVGPANIREDVLVESEREQLCGDLYD